MYQLLICNAVDSDSCAVLPISAVPAHVGSSADVGSPADLCTTLDPGI